jgi:tRNA U38,U39,U40 pseudouridine synthase TruA
MNEDEVRAALAGPEPALAGAAAPAKGLTLRRVIYAAKRNGTNGELEER